MAAWIVLEDARWTIAFSASLAWVPALVAACAGDPLTTEDLLVAADFYRRGMAAEVTDRLVAADRVRLGKQPFTPEVDGVAEAPGGGVAALPVRAAEEGRLHIALPRHRIEAQGRVAGLIRSRGELEVWNAGRGTGKYVTYQLPGHWSVRVAREAR